MSKYMLNSNIREHQVEINMAMYLGHISKSSPLKLHDVIEETTGADVKLDAVFPFFIQYKVSQGLRTVSSMAPLTSNPGRLQRVREFRHNKGLNDDPTLYFELRKQAKTAEEFQHNILKRYANTGFSQAFYVAPLHLDKTDYYDSLFSSVEFAYQKQAYNFKTRKIRDGSLLTRINNVPFFKEHVSIIPHEYVTTYKHYYSYSKSGRDIAWHSPAVLSEEPSRLSDVLSSNIKKCIEEQRFMRLDTIDTILNKVIEDIGPPVPSTGKEYLSDVNMMFSDNSLEIDSKEERLFNTIQKKARYIYERSRIRLLLVRGNSEDLIRKQNCLEH